MSDKKSLLLQSAVRAIAKYGMSAVSTRRISHEADLNDAYIYRLFRDKADLLAQAFLMEDEKYLRYVGSVFEELNRSLDIPLRKRAEDAFHKVWRYLLDTPYVCRVFMYYYHSPGFVEHAKAEHERQIEILTETIDYLFPTFEDARSSLLVLFALINTFALGAINGLVEDTEEIEKKVFRITYATLRITMHPEHELE